MKSSKSTFFLGFFGGMAVVAVIGFFVMLIMFFAHGQDVNLAVQAEEQLAAQEEPQAAPVPALKEGELFKGGKDAKVVIVEYTDFECPVCLRFHDVANQLAAEFGNQIQYILRNFPLSYHPEAQKAAEAFECAGEQNKAFEMADIIFNANKAGTMSVSAWKTSASTLGLNTTQFNNCLDSDKYAQKVLNSRTEGTAVGVTGTPAVFVNGQQVGGFVPFEQFKPFVEQLLAQ